MIRQIPKIAVYFLLPEVVVLVKNVVFAEPALVVLRVHVAVWVVEAALDLTKILLNHMVADRASYTVRVESSNLEGQVLVIDWLFAFKAHKPD